MLSPTIDAKRQKLQDLLLRGDRLDAKILEMSNPYIDLRDMFQNYARSMGNYIQELQKEIDDKQRQIDELELKLDKAEALIKAQCGIVPQPEKKGDNPLVK